ncbi:MAG TPA: tRNA preQ1(34) S-adenosylmethionine ribosyltransferase-isomerase QueA [Gaiellaceae bacterium]|jgi:S-adenosylmethionine:tRNA ribosyltransferase-isomerase|nr:tRNA preQ1(34) S-adenosylmethionine ribosyltransferase-isomerase QueA [Gaiellaceae bacterium]
MDTSALEYELPPELIAQRPAERRDESRLLVYERTSGKVRHRRFSELPEELAPDELVVVNETRVIPARLRLERPGGGEAEVLLLERVGTNGLWEGLARPSRRLKPGQRLGPVELLEPLGGGRWRLRLEGEPAGEAPLPPYIRESLADPNRYQTVYAREEGSAAAPTAGLHFTPELLERLDVERVTLHVGLDTFRPVESATLEEHEIHTERYSVEPAAWERIRAAERVLAVGTTTTRVLETLASNKLLQAIGPARDPAPGAEAPGGREPSNKLLQGRTGLFITPGFEFKRVDSLLTNFHLPRSTLLALVMAFAGIEETRRLYELAIAERYRFYSFGDAMLIR